ncbi:MAG: cell envelope integrity protein TolA [Gammaproteobacteria bacterium]|nr:cell envelope integrity protein TolA [Gammaproteobacteria bacterium]
MSARARDRWLPLGGSVLLHALLIAVLAWGVWHFEHVPPAPQSLAIEAIVVDARTVQGTSHRPAPAQLERQRLESARRAAEARQAETARRTAVETGRRARAERETRARTEQQAHADEMARRKAEAERQAEAQRRAAAERAAVQARERAASEAELQRGLEAEERARSAASSGLRAQWEAQIRARIQRAWIQPASARPGIECEVYMTQVPGGEVVNVRIGECNGDAAVRQSIEAAAYRASPLPPPPDPALFERSLVVRFRPRLETG